MRIVLALGGNALLERGQALTAQNQRDNIKKAVNNIAAVAAEHEVVIVHGNGPQVGLLIEHNIEYKKLYEHSTPYPMDVLGAETCGMVGYMLQQELQNAGPQLKIATILNQTQVDLHDNAFNDPTKFVGPVYSEDVIDQIRAENPTATYKKDGDVYRRVVASPEPLDILETTQICDLLSTGNTVIACGGGGIPVCKDSNGHIHGVECVVDKDSTAELLAEKLSADLFVVLTDGSVYQDFGKPNQKEIKIATPPGLSELDFPAGSMGPKIDAVCKFVNQGFGDSAIGSLNFLSDIIEGKSGTKITKGEGLEYYL